MTRRLFVSTDKLVHGGVPRVLAVFLGVLFIGVTLFLPNGIVGLFRRSWGVESR